LQKAAEAERWEKRVNQLQAKYGKVDLEEYTRVESQLNELQKSLKDSIPRIELEKVGLLFQPHLRHLRYS
jgi:hypothetical protein